MVVWVTDPAGRSIVVCPPAPVAYVKEAGLAGSTTTDACGVTVDVYVGVGVLVAVGVTVAVRLTVGVLVSALVGVAVRV